MTTCPTTRGNFGVPLSHWIETKSLRPEPPARRCRTIPGSKKRIRRPVDQFGLPELALLQHLSLAGLALDDTIFLAAGDSASRSVFELDESLHFHEMVHIVQWARLGSDNFLLT